jgi:hypothetical protein
VFKKNIIFNENMLTKCVQLLVLTCVLDGTRALDEADRVRDLPGLQFEVAFDTYAGYLDGGQIPTFGDAKQYVFYWWGCGQS